HRPGQADGMEAPQAAQHASRDASGSDRRSASTMTCPPLRPSPVRREAWTAGRRQKPIRAPNEIRSLALPVPSTCAAERLAAVSGLGTGRAKDAGDGALLPPKFCTRK